MDDAGAIRDLSGIVPDIVGDTLDDATLDRLRGIDLASLPLVSGTPPGVGMGQQPATYLYLKAGDRIELGVEGLGVQRQNVVAG